MRFSVGWIGSLHPFTAVVVRHHLPPRHTFRRRRLTEVEEATLRDGLAGVEVDSLAGEEVALGAHRCEHSGHQFTAPTGATAVRQFRRSTAIATHGCRSVTYR